MLKNVIAGEENIQIKELSTRVRELLRENRSILKQYVTVVKTKAISGQYPVLTLEDSLLKEVTDGVEMTEENDGIGFKLVKFSMSKKGRLFVLNDTVLKFSAADLIAYVARLFVQCYVRTVNKAILDKMLFDEDGITRAEHKVITGVQGVVSATRTDLDSELEGGAKLFVHKTTYDKLANDINAKDGIAWLQPDLSQPAKMYINGVEVVKVAKELESYEKKGDPNTKVYPVLYANLEQAILMFEDDEYTTDMQKNFRRNCVDQKIITYFDVAVADEEAFKLLGIEESTI